MTSTSRSNSALRDFLASEAAGGVILMLVAILAMVVANSPLADSYFNLLHAETGPVLSDKLGPMTVHLWINDALMAVFFLLVGLEIKREFVDGRLVTWQQRRLPFIAALGGMAAPALVFLAFTASAPALARGWAIPAATDIAFAIGVMALLGSRVPTALKLFLTTVAIVDDMGAVVIIALAYTASIKGLALLAAAAILGGMMLLNRTGVRHLAPYLAGFALLWFAVLVSGVHATIAGVLAAFTVPVVASPGKPDSPDSPLHRLEHGLHPWSAFLIVPLFGFANAGISLKGFSLGTLLQPLPLGIAAGLFLGKQLGIFSSIWIAVKLGIAQRPRGSTWLQVYGLSALCGIGFTMSLFIGMLAFATTPELVEEAKLGVMAGSLLAGVLGFLVLRFASPAADAMGAEAEIEREIATDGDVTAIETVTGTL
ncbi:MULTISPECIES: Na+/H+ antiporter NhaA [unclassified Novosphingobium]|uniref:Na+/H+ antiporter NhaA n=1 Tax=unclassified Novosphingobium TaxID=2644732 RepID=UPI0025F2B42F|nr:MULTISPECIES: Na+/H+ antiporter NhaA [unclassified Novosphingobium]HQV02852.1 Na+/H+ antiporter NhaA [Novosphingobium sp.]